MSKIEGRVALITGASSGLGAAIARALDERGAKLALASRRGSDEGIAARSRRCDVRDPGQIESLVAAAVERFGGLDIVVANAGVGGYGDFLDLDRDLEEIIDVNVNGLLYTVRASLPLLLESDAAELAVVASIAGQRAPEGEAVYAACEARAGRLHALARPRAVEPRRALLDALPGRGRDRVRDAGPRPRARRPRPGGLHERRGGRRHRRVRAHAPAHAAGPGGDVLPMAEDSMG